MTERNMHISNPKKENSTFILRLTFAFSMAKCDVRRMQKSTIFVVLRLVITTPINLSISLFPFFSFSLFSLENYRYAHVAVRRTCPESWLWKKQTNGKWKRVANGERSGDSITWKSSKTFDRVSIFSANQERYARQHDISNTIGQTHVMRH